MREKRESLTSRPFKKLWRTDRPTIHRANQRAYQPTDRRTDGLIGKGMDHHIKRDNNKKKNMFRIRYRNVNLNGWIKIKWIKMLLQYIFMTELLIKWVKHIPRKQVSKQEKHFLIYIIYIIMNGREREDEKSYNIWSFDLYYHE